MPSTLSLLQSAAYAKDAVPAQALLDFVLALSRVRPGQQAILKVTRPDALLSLHVALLVNRLTGWLRTFPGAGRFGDTKPCASLASTPR